MVRGSRVADEGVAGVTAARVMEAVAFRSRAAALDAALCGIRHAIDRLHEEADAVAATIHLPGGDKLSAGMPSAALIRMLTDQDEALTAPPADPAEMAEAPAAPVAIRTDAAQYLLSALDDLIAHCPEIWSEPGSGMLPKMQAARAAIGYARGEF